MTIDFFYRHKAGALLFCYLVVATMFLTLPFGPVIVALRYSVTFLITPEVVLTGHFFNKVDNLSGRLFRLIRAEAENEILRSQNAILSKRDVEREALEEENNRLREMIDLKQKVFSTGVVASVLGPDPRSWFRTITIDKGARHGVVLSAAVVSMGSQKPTLVGRVIDVMDQTSKVLLITDVESAISAQVIGTPYLGLIEGRNKPTVMMKYLSQQVDIKVNDHIMTASLGGVFPPGIAIGSVGRISTSEDGFFREAVVVPFADFGSLREVMILSRSDWRSKKAEP